MSKAKEGDTEEVRLDLDTDYKISFLIESEIIYWMSLLVPFKLRVQGVFQK